MSGQTWTPAPRKGAIPLHPMTFGTILGRAFSALRHNPKVLFGFAVAVQFAVTAAAVVVAVLIGGYAAERIARVPAGSPDAGPIIAGTVALGVIVAVIVTLASVAFTSVVQGLVAADISLAALGRRAGLRDLWARVRPAFWRLFGFALLQGLAVFLWLLLLAGIAIGVMSGTGFDGAGVGIAVLLVVALILASIPLIVWLSTKLLVVPAVLVLERATIPGAILRSWRLLRGRFWAALGVMFLIGAIMGLAAQVVSIPGSVISAVLGGVLAPTGAPDETEIVTLIAATVLPQILVLAVQAITLVVQGTGATLIYIDCRMRYEGLDQTLIRHVERSALGASDAELGDPYAVDPARAVSKNPPPPAAAYPVAPGYPPAGYPPGAPHPQSSGNLPYSPGHPPPPPAAGPPHTPPPSPYGEATPDRWAAPGGDG
ncbi:hypothetical protein [Microbacterium sp. USHLN186]|uniref:hypothetical protein n=1 Tax=Microbacterium sp. USHLN186 TaxID=3081286 RepID=UPI003019664F